MTTQPRPTEAPYTPPLLPGSQLESAPPIKGARLAWAHCRAGWASVWALPAERGLAVQITPCKAPAGKGRVEWRLAILHEASGLTVCSAREGGAAPILNTPKDRRTIQALLADLLKLPVDWTGSPTLHHSPNELGGMVFPLIARHFPAIPEWRAWVRDKDGKPAHRWHRSHEAALAWATGSKHGGWWMVEAWAVPPADDPPPDFAAIARGEMPPGMTGATWLAWGTVRASTPGNPAPPLLLVNPTLAANVHSLAYQSITEWPTLPTGERSPIVATALAEGIVSISDRHPQVFLPTRTGVLLAARAALAGEFEPPRDNQRTRDALAEYQECRSKYRTGSWSTDEAHFVLGDLFEAGLHLLSCIARDRSAPAPRFELGTRWAACTGDRLRVLSHAGGVACLEVQPAAGRTWVTLRTRPAVAWARNSALVPVIYGDPEGLDRRTSIDEHSAADWAENHAARLRSTALVE